MKLLNVGLAVNVNKTMYSNPH